MKRVIRKGVFETNSSSTHTLTLKKKDEKETKKCSFELKSPLAKTVWLMGVIDNANKNYNEIYKILEKKDVEYRYKKDFIDFILTLDEGITKDIKEKYGDIKKASITTLIKIAQEFIFIEYLPTYFPYYNSQLDFIVSECLYQTELLRYKDILLDAYCEIENIDKKEALDKIYYEAYKNRHLFNLIKSSKCPKKAIEEYMEEGYGRELKEKYEKNKEEDLEKVAFDYIQEEVDKCIKCYKGEISCQVYFREGSLDECECGFENFYNIFHKLGLKDVLSDEKKKEHALKFLKDYKIVGKEFYCSVYLEGNGESY